MNVYDLIEKMDGHILANKAYAKDGDVEVQIGYFDGPELVFTPEGDKLALAQADLAAKKKRPVAKPKTS